MFNTLNNGAPLHFQVKQPGITISLVLSHGDADAFTEERTVFPLTAEGRRQADLVARCLTRVGDVARHTDSTEDICDKLAKIVNEPATALFQLLEPYIRCDARFEENLAWPSALVIEETDEVGVTRRAMFPGPDGQPIGYLKLGFDHDAHLTPWAKP